jgi:hypothetical protein
MNGPTNVRVKAGKKINNSLTDETNSHKYVEGTEKVSSTFEQLNYLYDDSRAGLLSEEK